MNTSRRFFFFKQKTAYELSSRDWSSDVCSSDLVTELAPADLVHPDPFPGGTHEHHLLGDVAEGADAFARPLEPLRGARRQILERGLGLGTLARGGVEIGRPVPGRLMIDGDHDVVYCKRRVTERKRPASSRRAIDTPGTAMRPSRLMLSLITS